MKTFLYTAGLLSLACFTLTALAEQGEDLAWLDLEKCGVCKAMGEHPEMMASMQWETHVIDNGMLSVGVVPKKHQQTMKEVHAKMEQAGQQAKAGKEMSLCGFCKSYGQLLEAGAREQLIETEFGMVSLLTSDDPELVAKIKKHAERTKKEYAAIVNAQARATN